MTTEAQNLGPLEEEQHVHVWVQSDKDPKILVCQNNCGTTRTGSMIEKEDWEIRLTALGGYRYIDPTQLLMAQQWFKKGWEEALAHITNRMSVIENVGEDDGGI